MDLDIAEVVDIIRQGGEVFNFERWGENNRARKGKKKSVFADD
ncbi:hypothetical protein V6S20_20835 [Klebsiella pneumoniae]